MYMHTHIYLAHNCEDIISLQLYQNGSITFLSFYVIILSRIIGYNSSLKWREYNKISESKKKIKNKRKSSSGIFQVFQRTQEY